MVFCQTAGIDYVSIFGPAPQNRFSVIFLKFASDSVNSIQVFNLHGYHKLS